MWDVAVGAGAFVLLAGGMTAMVKRTMRPEQAVRVVVVALGVALVAAFASRLPNVVLVFLAIASTVVGGAAMAVAIVSRPESRIP